MIAFIVFLFVVLTPGVILTLPPNGSKTTVAMVHGILFAFIYYFISAKLERFTDVGPNADAAIKGYKDIYTKIATVGNPKAKTAEL